MPALSKPLDAAHRLCIRARGGGGCASKSERVEPAPLHQKDKGTAAGVPPPPQLQGKPSAEPARAAAVVAEEKAPSVNEKWQLPIPETLQWQNPDEIFDKLDTDGRGTLELSELIEAIVGAGYAEKHAIAIFAELDANKDGEITRQEWRERFYASSLVQAKHPADETFEDLHHGRAGCSIDKTELRAISVAQLSDVRAHIERRCPKEGWTNLQMAVLTAKSVTLYDAARYVIKPATYARQCAFVELVAEGEQRPKWFTSHWWGEPVLDFVACIETHAIDHGYRWYNYEPKWVDDGTSYWVCAVRACAGAPDLFPCLSDWQPL